MPRNARHPPPAHTPAHLPTPRFQFFAYPVDLEKYPKYREVCPSPMDLSTIKARLDAGSYRTYEGLLTVSEAARVACFACFLRSIVRAGVLGGGHLGRQAQSGLC